MEKKNLSRLICYCGLFAALSIVFGKLMQIPIGNSLRLSFENLPIFCAAWIFGPWVGALVAVAADLVGCLIVGFTINPVITLGAAICGFLSGTVFRVLQKKQKRGYFAAFSGIAIAHFFASVLIKSAGLYLYYSTPFSVLIWRFPIYLVTALLESLILYELSKTSVFSLWRKADEV